MAHGKSVRIYLADGTPTGVRHAEVVNWTGQAIACPRNRIGELADWAEVAERPGVYFLFGHDENDDAPLAYIGEAENVRARVRTHVSTKEFWTELIFFTSKDLNLTKGHAKYLESRLIQLATDAGRYRLENGTAPAAPQMPRPDADAMDEFIDVVRIVVGTLGHPILHPSARSTTGRTTDASSDWRAQRQLTMDHKGRRSFALQTDEGFLLLAGSMMDPEIAPSASDRVRQLRAELEASGLLTQDGDGVKLHKDVSFRSSSGAAGFVAGASRSGPGSWRVADGRLLSEAEADAIADGESSESTAE